MAEASSTGIRPSAVEAFDKNDAGLAVPPGHPAPVLLIVMGPASCGKSTIGQAVADAFHLPFIDGDALHPKSNVEKMSAGIPLTDDDRLPWLALIRSTAERKGREMSKHTDEYTKEKGGIGRPGVVIACSALKKYYRDILRGRIEAIPPAVDDLPPSKKQDLADKKAHVQATSNMETLFLYCHGEPEVLAQRIAARKNHFMGPQMLKSQLATLEDPRGEPGVAWVNIDQSVEAVSDEAERNTRKLFEALDQQEKE